MRGCVAVSSSSATTSAAATLGTARMASRLWSVPVIVAVCSVLVFITPRPASAFVEKVAPASRMILGVPTPVTLGVTAVVACIQYCAAAWDFISNTVMGKTSEDSPGSNSMQCVFGPLPAYTASGLDAGTTFSTVCNMAPGFTSTSYNITVTWTCQSNASTARYTHSTGVDGSMNNTASKTDTFGNGCVGGFGNNPDGNVGGRIVEASAAIASYAGNTVVYYLKWAASVPNRETQTTATCRNGAQTVTAQRTGIYTAGSNSSLAVPDCEAILPGSYLENLRVKERGAGSTEPWEDRPSLLDRGTNLQDMPECTAATASCTVAWATPVKDVPTPCKWGPYILPDSDCEPLGPKPVYDPGTAPSPGPSPSPSASPSPAIKPPPVYDPNAPDPNAPAQPGTTPGTPGAPRLNPDGSTTTTQTNPDGSTTTRTVYPDGSTVTTTRGPSVTNPDGTTSPGPTTTVRTPPLGAGQALPSPDGDNCISRAFSFNPIDWVYWPVRCALQWAFVPSAGAVAAKLDTFRGGLATAAPWAFILAGPPAIGALVAGIDAPAACGGAQITDVVLVLPMNTAQPWCALKSSDGFGPFTVGSMRNVAVAGIWIVFAWAVYRRAQRLIGAEGPPEQPTVGSAENDIDMYNGYAP